MIFYNDHPLIQIYSENAEKELKAIKEIKADLSLGEYEIDVIAGTQMPRSRSEKAQIYLQLAQMGKIPNTKTGTELLLNALDIPDKTGIIEAIEEQAKQMESSQPPISLPPELAEKLFKDMPLDCQLQYLAQFGFQVPTPQQAVNTELAQEGKMIPQFSQEGIINGGI